MTLHLTRCLSVIDGGISLFDHILSYSYFTCRRGWLSESVFFFFSNSTSLNSLEPETYPRESSSTVDGNVAGVLQADTVAKAVGKLEHALQSEQRRVQNPNEFAKSTQRSSYMGPGFFHKSISSPSMQRHDSFLLTLPPMITPPLSI